MKLIKPSFEIWNQPAGLEGVYKQIERVGRVCYKSEDKITEDSAKPFVDRMIKSGHSAMLEHGTVYLDIICKSQDGYNTEFFKYEMNPYSKCTEVPPNVMQSHWHLMVTTNLRVLIENGWLNDLQYICKPTEFHEKRITVKFILSRSIAQEYTRHRVFSFAMESQRYCAYNKNKFGNEVTFIIPCWLNWDEQVIHRGDFEKSGSGSMDSYIFVNSLLDAESSYLDLVKENWKAQQAREVLPNACKTELVMTGFVSDWNHFFDLRARGTTGAPHPQAKELAEPLMKEFIARKYINN